MEYEESYHGQRILISTLQAAGGGWTAQAALLESGRRKPVPEGADQRFPSEAEARQAALSVAAAAIDRARMSIGKP